MIHHRLHSSSFKRLLLPALAWAFVHSGAAQAQASPVVHVAEGELVGQVQDGIGRFLGVPYAQPPVGEWRWAAPRPPKPWPGQRDARQFAAACPQVPEPLSDNALNSEDCLFLNVYAPQEAAAKPRPVIVWVPGSGTVLGSGRLYDAQQLAKATQAVVVTMNYRLGALGWLWTSGMASEKKGHNFALQDQQEALRWVQRNIARFNGDPGNVTLAGESIGATSVSLHLVSPTASGLFHRVMMASGIEPPGLLSSEQVAARGDEFAVRLGCQRGPSQLACLRAKTPDEILKVSPTYADLGRIGIYWKYFVDGEMVTGDVFSALSSGKFNRVPIMVGSTLDDGRGFIPLAYDLDGTAMTEAEYVEAIKQFLGPQMQPLMTGLLYTSKRMGSPSAASSQVWTDAFACQAVEAAKRASAYVPAYAYEFADRQAPTFLFDPFLEVGAHHGTDLMYWFQRPVGIAASDMRFSPAQQRLSDQMVRYWRQFAEVGNPNGAGPAGAAPLAAWPKYNGLNTPVLTLLPDGVKPQEWGAFQRAHQCGAWSLLFALRALGAA